MKFTLVLYLFTSLFSWAWTQELKNDILVFKSKEDAVSYSFRSFWDYVPHQAEKEAYKNADQIVENLWPHFCKTYKNCDDYPKPEILLSYSAGSGSFGMTFEGKLRQSNAIILSWEIHDQPKDLEFVIAHELVHYFEKHAEKESMRESIYSIRRQTYTDCLNYPFPLDELKDNLLDIIKAMEHIGDKPFLVDSDLAIPFNGELGLVLDRMAEKSITTPGCSKLPVKLSKFRSKLKADNFISKSNKKVKEFLKLAEKCFEAYPGNLLRESILSLNLKITGPDPNLSTELDAIIRTNGPEIERLQSLRNILYKHYQDLSNKLSGPQLRFHTHEDEADIKALNILLNSGRRNLEESTDYLLVGLPPNQQLRCRKQLAAGVEPAYGPLNRFHHSECWRIWRAKRIEQSFLMEKTEQKIQETAQ